MSIDFLKKECQTFSEKELFGICDDPDPAKNPAYINEIDESKWIAIVENEGRFNVVFTAIDHCIEIKREDGKDAKRCDGFLTYNATIIFIELKQRRGSDIKWVKKGEMQLRQSISDFEGTNQDGKIETKRAYIANSERPQFKDAQMTRMEKFREDTGHVLRIENRIILD